MRSVSLLLAAATLIAGAAAQTKWASPKAIAAMERNYNCDCHCECAEKSEHPCNVDYFVLLDAASCVRDAWMEMLNRVRNLAKSIDDSGRQLGSETRFAVMRYAEHVEYDIKFEENLNYRSFSQRLGKLETYNAGSFLNKGWAAMKKMAKAYKANPANANRRLIVIVVTNGISHPGNQNVGSGSPTTKQIKELNDVLWGPTVEQQDNESYAQYQARKNRDWGLFVNTIISIKNEFAQADDCFACKYNEEMFRAGGLETDMDKQYGQVFSKNKLEDKLLNHIDTTICLKPNTPTKVCNDCICQCDLPSGPKGPPGAPGEPGKPGWMSGPGGPGPDGEDGGCGVPGPDGAPGCNGKDGNPGHHGKPGKDGENGPSGDQGSEGPEGPAGRAARPAAGKKGPAGEQGSYGPHGDAGQNGRPGQKGRNGEPGKHGPVGLTGDNGEAGEKGPHGQPGQDGQPGERGYPGLDGVPGDFGKRGKKGSRGMNGQPGATGPAGMDGPPGQPGLCGAPGEKGVTGMKGPVGAPGIMGDDVDDNYVREQVREMLDRLLPKKRDARFCKCKAYSLYNVISQNLNF